MISEDSLSEMIDILSRYLVDEMPKLAERYIWKIPVNCPVKFEVKDGSPLSLQNIALKLALANAWESDLTSRFYLARWFVASWGGVRRNSENTLLGYVAASNEELANSRIKGIASWSKVLAMRAPDKFAIFDARVSIALNALQIMNAKHSHLFPNLPSQNPQIKAFQKWLKITPHISELPKIDGDSVYYRYLKLLHQSSNALGPNGLAVAEMTLFANAERLAKSAMEEWQGT